MRMRLAHTSAVHHHHTQTERREKMKNNRKRQTKRMEHKLMFYDYFMIFMDRILCDRNLFIFSLLHSLHRIIVSVLDVVWCFELLLSTPNLSELYARICGCLYFPGNLLSISCCRFPFSFSFLVCVWANVCRRAHVQEMWDRLCFYCIAWPKIDGIRLQSTRLSKDYALFTFSYWLFIYHFSPGLLQPKRNKMPPLTSRREKNWSTSFTLEPASFRLTHVVFIFSGYFLPLFGVKINRKRCEWLDRLTFACELAIMFARTFVTAHHTLDVLLILLIGLWATALWAVGLRAGRCTLLH